jgi:hypothetical protein
LAGIGRGRRPSGTWGGFVGSVLALLVAWGVSGSILASAVERMMPGRQVLLNDVRLSGPASGAYQGVDVIGRGTGWVGDRPAMTVRLEFLPLPGPGGAAPKPPAPLQVTPGTTSAAVLQWMAGAGLDASNPRVRDEAQAAAMHAIRTLRLHGRFGTGGYTTTSIMGQLGPFARTSVTVRGSSEHPNVPTGVFVVFWVAVLVVAVTFLWRAARPRRVVERG